MTDTTQKTSHPQNTMPSTLRKLALATFALSLAPVPLVHAQALSSFNFYGTPNYSGSTPSTRNSTGIDSSALSLGSGLSYDNNFGDVYAVTPDNQPTLAAAETAGDFIAVTVNPTAGYTVSLTALNFAIVSFGGPTTLTFTDSSNNPLGTVVAAGSSNTGPGNAGSYNEPTSLPLAGVGTFDASTTFRLYVYGNTDVDTADDHGAPNTIGFNSASPDASGDSFVIDGTAAAPEPSTAAFIAAGALLLGCGILRRGRRAVL